MRELPDPTTARRVVAVWAGICRTHGAPPIRTKFLLPRISTTSLEACPVTRTFELHPAEPDLASLHDQALLLIGFSALRRAELHALTVDDISEQRRGLVLSIPRSNTDLYSTDPELVVLPYTQRRGRCPATALATWLDTADSTDGPVLHKISRGNGALAQGLRPESVNEIVQRAAARVGLITAAPGRRARCGPGTSPTPTRAGLPTAPSPTRPGTAPWPPSAPTPASTTPETTTLQRSWPDWSKAAAGWEL